MTSASPPGVLNIEGFVRVWACVWARLAVFSRRRESDWGFWNGVVVSVKLYDKKFCVSVFLSPCAVSLRAALLKEDGCHRACCPLARVYWYDSLFIISTSLLLLLHNDPVWTDIFTLFPEALSGEQCPASVSHTHALSLFVPFMPVMYFWDHFSPMKFVL